MAAQPLCLLTGEEIVSENLVEGGEDRLFRATTYDLSVGDIIPADGEVCGQAKYSLPPGGMVRVISKEVLRLPPTITGHVLLKNALCSRGVLAINIGVVDPGFEGPISSTLINFGRRKYDVTKGIPFLRVSFFRCPESPRAARSKRYDRRTYLEKVSEEVLAYSGPKFLNLDELTAKAAETAFGSFKDSLVLWGGLVAVLLALLAIFAPLGASFVDKYLASQDQQKLEERIKDDESRIKDLSDQIRYLKNNSDAPGPHATGTKK